MRHGTDTSLIGFCLPFLATGSLIIVCHEPQVPLAWSQLADTQGFSETLGEVDGYNRTPSVACQQNMPGIYLVTLRRLQAFL